MVSRDTDYNEDCDCCVYGHEHNLAAIREFHPECYPCDVCNSTGLTYDPSECRMVPCGGICCKVRT